MKKLLFPTLALALGVGCGWLPAPNPRPGESGPRPYTTKFGSTDGSGKKPAALPRETTHLEIPKASPSVVVSAPRAAPQVRKPPYGLPLVIECPVPEVPSQLLKPSPPVEDLR
jgi:hypothetical protein